MKNIKASACITIDSNLLAEARSRDIKLSHLVNNLLGAYFDKIEVEDTDIPDKMMDLDVQMANMKNTISSMQKRKDVLNKLRLQEEVEKNKIESKKIESGILRDI